MIHKKLSKNELTDKVLANCANWDSECMEDYWEDQAETLRNKVESLRAALAVYADKENWERAHYEYDMLDLWAGPVGDEINEDGDIPNNGFYLAERILEDTE